MAKQSLPAKTKKKKTTQPTSPALRLSSSAKFTLFLLFVMFLIGGATALVGYMFGRNSLRGITQPDVNPFLNSAGNLNQHPRQGVSFLKEEELIKQVKAQTQGNSTKEAPKPKETKKPKEVKKTKATEKDKKETQEEAKKAPDSFPIRLENQAVKLDIRALEQKKDDLVLTIAMVNGGSQPVQFIYTFLDVTDEQGYALSSEVSGIPETIPPKSETYVGSITVFDTPEGSLERLNLKLTDYPSQKVKLEVKDIPVQPKEKS